MNVLSEVPSNGAQQLKAGDICLDCQRNGLENRLRYFLINLEEETLLKCESDHCMYPYNEDIETSSDEDTDNYTLTELVNYSTQHYGGPTTTTDNILDDILNATDISFTNNANVTADTLNEIFIANEKKPVKKERKKATTKTTAKSLKQSGNLGGEIFIKNEPTATVLVKKETKKPVAKTSAKKIISTSASQQVQIKQEKNNCFLFTSKPPTSSIGEMTKAKVIVPPPDVKAESTKVSMPSIKTESSKISMPSIETECAKIPIPSIKAEKCDNEEAKKQIKIEKTNSNSTSTEAIIPKASLLKGHQYLNMIKDNDGPKIRMTTKRKKSLMK
ncbi:uncharacterized protein [Musca autumnalis]|uniref:uncharacterized protein n=1 Tax=Musca autumnalis TaxID=221902 RepID=UPI003CEB6A5A